MTVKENPKGKQAIVVDDGSTGDALFPSVAVSDAINTAAHVFAAWVVLPVSLYAALGFALVAIAAAFGTARFGINARLFRPGNESLAEIAAFVGLPLIGFAASARYLPATVSVDVTVLAVVLACIGAVARGFPHAATDAIRTIVVSATFIVGLVYDGAIRRDGVLVRPG